MNKTVFNFSAIIAATAVTAVTLAELKDDGQRVAETKLGLVEMFETRRKQTTLAKGLGGMRHINAVKGNLYHEPRAQDDEATAYDLHFV